MRAEALEQLFFRIAHYFRDVDLTSNSRPGFIPEHFSFNCGAEDKWSGLFLLRVAIRFRHIWATFGVKSGHATVLGSQAAVCFSGFDVDDLIAARDGMAGFSDCATQYAITFPLSSAQSGGVAQVIQGGDHREALQREHPSVEVTHAEIEKNLYRYADGQLEIFDDQSRIIEWRWPYPQNYHRAIDKIEREGRLGDQLPGINLTQKKWSGIGVVVATYADAVKLQYDILTLIDQRHVKDDHFDHLLICERLPKSLNGLSDSERRDAIEAACFDFKSSLTVFEEAAANALSDFSARVAAAESSTPKKEARERGGCWIYFEDNSHSYVRALLKAGRLVITKHGRYLGTLDELGRGRDLREREGIVKALCKQLEQEYGVACSYYSVLNSWLPDDSPSFCGHPWSGNYRITDESDELGA